MPYLNDLRRTVTVNLDPDDYALLADDALEAGYTSAGTYAKALVLSRGEAPAPTRDRRSAEQIGRLEGQKQWLLLQYEQLREQLSAAGLVPRLAPATLNEPEPRSRGAQDRAIAAAVAAARG